MSNTSETRGEFSTVSLRSQLVYLRVVTPGDYELLHQAETSPELGPRWRHRGATPGPEEWAQGLWASVLAQFLVVEAANNQPIGIVAAYKGNFRDGHARLAAARFGSAARTPLMAFGFALFVRYVFHNWDLRKLYLEVPEFNLDQFSSIIEKYAVVEGRLKDHVFAAGAWWDELILAVYRETWEERGSRLVSDPART